MKTFGIVLLILIVAGAIVGLVFWKQPASTTPAESTTNVNAPTQAQRSYHWSTMQGGPYRDKISFATSMDLLHWTDTGRILVDHASVPDAVVRNGEVFLYFVDVSEDGVPEQIGLLRSTDQGATWSDREIVDIEGKGAIVPVDPSALLLDDGRIRLYYLDIATAQGPEAAGTGAVNRIYSAVSDDGIHFTQEDGVRFVYEGIFDPSVIHEGDTWRMYVGTADGQRTLSAVSDDGITFTFEGTAFSGGAIPEAVFAFDTYFLFTGGIQIASSQDGRTFTATGDRFSSSVNPLTADPSVVTLDDGTYLLFYKTR